LKGLDEKRLPEPLRFEKLIYMAVAKAKQGLGKQSEQEISKLSESYPGLSTEFQDVMQISP